MKAYKRVSNDLNWAAKGNVLTAPGFHIFCLVVQALVMLSRLSSCPMQSCPCFPKANPTAFIKSWSLTTKFIVGESWDVNILRVIRNRQPLWHFQVGCKSRGVIGPIGNPQLHLRKHEYSWRGGGILSKMMDVAWWLTSPFDMFVWDRRKSWHFVFHLANLDPHFPHFHKMSQRILWLPWF